MPWQQMSNPLGSAGLSALVAAVPILFLFYALAVKKMKGHLAGILTLAVVLLDAVLVYKMPAPLAAGSALYGMLTGLFPIGWIVFGAVLLYNMTVKTGQFEIIKDSVSSISEDRRIQVLLIAFSFSSFLEGAAGFGTPVAIASAMLIGLGFEPFYAACLALVANSGPVAFGGIGIPILTGAAVAGVDPNVMSTAVARQLPLFAFIVPFFLIGIMSGLKGIKELLPAILVSGGSYAVTMWLVAEFMGPLLPTIIASWVSIIALVVLMRFWQPKTVWKFASEAGRETVQVQKHSFGAVLKAWSPFVILTVLIGDWGVKAVGALLDRVTVIFPFPLINHAIMVGGKPMEVVYKLNWLSAAGTAIIIATIISAVCLRVPAGKFFSIVGETFVSLRFALLTIAAVLGFAYVANYSGMTTDIGRALTLTGRAFPFVSPFLGWLGVFLTGSDTSSNALFCKMQGITASQIGVNPMLTIAANSSGGVAGKMISPQSIAVASGAVNLVGREGELFAFTVKYSVLFTAIIGLITTLQAYVFPWMMPVLKAGGKATHQAVNFAGGEIILTVTMLLLIVFGAYASRQKTVTRA